MSQLALEKKGREGEKQRYNLFEVPKAPCHTYVCLVHWRGRRYHACDKWDDDKPKPNKTVYKKKIKKNRSSNTPTYCNYKNKKTYQV